MVLLGSTEGRVNVMFGLRADFKLRVIVGLALSEPGAGAAMGFVLGGSGCGGLESFGRVY